MGWTAKQVSFCCAGIALGLCLSPSGVAGKTQRIQLSSPSKEAVLGADLSLQATHLQYQPEAKSLELSGQVKVTGPELSLTADQLVVQLDAAGEVLALTASGMVTLTHRELSGSAKEARLVIKDSKLRLKGQVALQLPAVGLVLRGEQMVVDLATGKLTATAVSARISRADARRKAP